MADSDKDGLTDEFERRIGTDPFDKDSDNDGLMDKAEHTLGTNPRNFDSDGDGYMDGSEYAQSKSPTHPDPPNPYADRYGRRDQPFRATAEDPDADGLDEMQERMLKTNPNDPDSDGDGIGDGMESIGNRGRSPIKPEPITAPKPAPKAAAAPTTTDAADASGAISGAASDPRDAFLNAARAQMGDKYQFGAETDLDDANPTAFDSSELVQWAAHQAGVELPDGSWNQYRTLHEAGGDISVDHALKTPGALVFGFSSDPLASPDRPTRAYVGISLGDGRVLDVSERAGEVREMGPGNFYTHAAVVPDFVNNLPTGPGHPQLYDMLHPSSPLQRDTDGDGMLDVDESVVERDPFDPSDGAPTKPTTTPTPSDDANQGPTDGPVTSPRQVDDSLPPGSDDDVEITDDPEPIVDTTSSFDTPTDTTASLDSFEQPQVEFESFDASTSDGSEFVDADAFIPEEMSSDV